MYIATATNITLLGKRAHSMTPPTPNLLDTGQLQLPIAADIVGIKWYRTRFQDKPAEGVIFIRGGINASMACSVSEQSEEKHPIVGYDGLLEGSGEANSLSTVFRDNVMMSSPTHGSPIQNGERDLVTGKCSTCNSSVRWPRYLDVFRCTVCYMVNDLKSTTESPGEARYGCVPDSATASTTSTKPGIPSNVPFISLERTKRMIDECIDLFLQSRFEHENNDPSQISHGTDLIEDEGLRPLQSTSYLVNNMFCRSTEDSHAQTLPSPATAPLIAFKERSRDTPSKAPERFTQPQQDLPKSIFHALENYIIACFTGTECLNSSFLTSRPPPPVRAASESNIINKATSREGDGWVDNSTPFPELDAKTLLLGDFAENGTWWTGRGSPPLGSRPQTDKGRVESVSDRVNPKSPRINWSEVNEWFTAIASLHVISKSKLRVAERAGRWRDKNANANVHALTANTYKRHDVEEELMKASSRVQRTLLKACESLLRRPGQPIKHPADCRFLIILLTNPLLSMSDHSHSNGSSSDAAVQLVNTGPTPTLKPPPTAARQSSTNSQRIPNVNGSSSRHSGIIKRILGIIANLPPECHHHLVNWFSRFSEAHLRRFVDLIGSFVSYRLSRQKGGKRRNSHDPTAGGLIPSISGPGAGTSAQLHAALGVSTGAKSPDKANNVTLYGEDWQMKAAAKVMSLLFSANNNDRVRRYDDDPKSYPQDPGRARAGSAARKRARRHGQLLPTNAFYNIVLDRFDLIADFETWESRRGKFSFCQYPMFLSIWAKIRILEHDARRQMEIKAREAFFNSIMSRKAINQYLVLKVRRDCLVEDSLRGVSEVVGTGQEEIKKGLRIEFLGEEGLDSGGLRKEWFLLLVRDVFDPEHGLFVYDEDSHYCYFNPHSFETSDQFFLVGVLLGLAIYNSTILDVALPPFAFRKLLASAPNYAGPTTSTLRPSPGYTLDDLAEYRPAFAHGLRQMLEYDGDVERTFFLDFVAMTERYGQLQQIPLCLNGERRPVTNSNRREYVDLYIRYLLDIAVARQYEPFKRGFFTVCGGNALSLFRPEEIELLVRGSDEPLDVDTLRAVAVYDGWGKGIEAPNELPVVWFWNAFARASPKDQRKLLSFITASDRIPAMGATSLVIKITCLGNDCQRFPIARTCFNMIGLYRYNSRELLESRLWRAVVEGEGFGMK
ncbi:MAG: hypothetical protein Q9217_002717 [Psora testacea]